MDEDLKFEIKTRIDSKLESMNENIAYLHRGLNELASNITEINFLEYLLKNK